MKKVLKVITLILIITVVFLVAINIKAFASEEYQITAEKFSPDYNVHLEKETTIARRILGWIRNITVAAAVVIIAYFGLKFMYGSVEQRAEYKKSFIPLIVGLFIVASATSIMQKVWEIGEETNKDMVKNPATCAHSWDIEPSCTQGATCTKCGQEIAPLGHTSFSDLGNGYHICSLCGGAKAAHNMVNRPIVKFGQNFAFQFHGCDACDAIELHEFTDYTKDGIKGKKCKICGYFLEINS